MKIIYDTHKGGNATYASITKTDRNMVLSRLQTSFYRMLEDAFYDKDKEKLLKEQNPVYCKNSTDNKYNCLQTFLAGILGQHHNADRDFSEKQLEGITLASAIFDHFYGSSIIEFEKGDPRMPRPATLIDELFDR